MERAVIHFIILGVILGLTSGLGLLPDVLHAAIGESVTFTTSLTPTEKPFLTVGWTFGGRNIISFSGTNTTGPEYEGRITLFMSTGSLELRNVTVNDHGKYSVNIFPFGEPLKTGSTVLDVHVRVSDVIATASNTDLVEFNSSVRLSCSASGSSLSFLWLNGSSEVTDSDRVQLADGGANLTIVHVTRYDKGPFKCQVSNPVSNDISEPINFNISYGPQNVRITGPSKIHPKEKLTLTCSADSKPPATYIWRLNGAKIHNSAVFTKNNVERSDSGSYTCEAMNMITGRKSSAVHKLSVTESGGVISAIVLSCLAVVSVGAAGGYYYHKKKKNKNKAEPSSGNTDEHKEMNAVEHENTPAQ